MLTRLPLLGLLGLIGCYPWVGPKEHQANDPCNAFVWYRDADGDSFGDDADSVERCEQPDGYQGKPGDCDDTDPDVHPDAEELPWDGIDQDCDGVERCDEDGDGQLHDGPGCGGTDCDDTDATVAAGFPDTPYDGIDQDCSGADLCDADGDGLDAFTECGGTDCDDADPAIGNELVWFPDTDGDGYGDAAAAGSICEPAAATDVLDGSDCDDLNAVVHPERTDPLGDGVDDNCDGLDGVDADGDGVPSIASGGTDCDDNEATVFPGATDPEGDGVDQNCDGVDGTDADGDGFSETVDCDDADPDAFPGATELCDGVDNDCSGYPDDNQPQGALTWYLDGDGDGYGNPMAPVEACTAPPSFVDDASDCDDASAGVHPGALDDDAADGIDADCDGVPGVDADQDGYASLASNGTDCDDGSNVVHPGATDIPYDGFDQDCDGSDNCDADADGLDGLACGGPDCDDFDPAVGAVYWHPDVDLDGFGDPDQGQQCDSTGLANPTTDASDCDDSAANVYPGAPDTTANLQDDNCDGVPGVDADGDTHAAEPSGGDDCDDADPTVFTGAPDTVGNGVDNNCDGIPGTDVDADGYASTGSGGTDCDDFDPFQNLAGAEYCNGEDDDCNGLVDDGTPVDASLWYLDDDADGFGDPATELAACNAIGMVENSEDCDDADASVNPIAQDLVGNGVDNNCDGLDGVDDDGDGFASIPSGGTDCNDFLPDIYPGAPDTTANAVDNNCDGWPGVDSDGDKRASIASGGDDCDDTDLRIFVGAPDLADNGVDNNCDGVPGVDLDLDGFAGTATHGDDCDDQAPSVYPGAPEVPYDGVDQDCDGLDLCDVDADGVEAGACGGLDCDDADPGWTLPEWWYPDADTDGFGQHGAGAYVCVPDPGWVQDDQDCDDTNPSANLGLAYEFLVAASDVVSIEDSGAIYVSDNDPNRMYATNYNIYEVEGFAKFDLGTLGALNAYTIDDATLRLYQAWFSNNADPVIRVSWSAEDAWTQTDITPPPTLDVTVSEYDTTVGPGNAWWDFPLDLQAWDLGADVTDGWVTLGIDNVGAPSSGAVQFTGVDPVNGPILALWVYECP